MGSEGPELHVSSTVQALPESDRCVKHRPDGRVERYWVTALHGRNHSSAFATTAIARHNPNRSP
jgi:hypothetical protein